MIFLIRSMLLMNNICIFTNYNMFNFLKHSRRIRLRISQIFLTYNNCIYLFYIKYH